MAELVESTTFLESVKSGRELKHNLLAFELCPCHNLLILLTQVADNSVRTYCIMGNCGIQSMLDRFGYFGSGQSRGTYQIRLSSLQKNYVFYWPFAIICTPAVKDLKILQAKCFALGNKPIFCLADPIATFYSQVRRWKSQRSKIHRLAYRFSIDFLLQGLAFGFLSQSPRFLFGNHKHLPEVLEFGLVVEIF